MPHLTLEYSSNIREKENFHSLFHNLHHIIVRIAKADIESCKSRAIEHKTYYIGNGDLNRAFIHLKVQLLEGRPIQVRQEAGEEILKALAEHFSQSLTHLNLDITVEVAEIIKNLYFKKSKT